MRLQMKSNSKNKKENVILPNLTKQTPPLPSPEKTTNQIEKEKKEKQMTERGKKRRLHNPYVTVHSFITEKPIG